MLRGADLDLMWSSYKLVAWLPISGIRGGMPPELSLKTLIILIFSQILVPSSITRRKCFVVRPYSLQHAVYIR